VLFPAPEFLSRFDGKVDVGKNGYAWLVFKADVSKFYGSLESGGWPRAFAVSDLTAMLQNLDDALGAYTGLRKGIRRT